ncbi:uncharacterized protein LOC123676001 [Harmonia axyridis]|uniref:uncharacterized protein LOC123676001 n=1 Tax=Harmonia axyridis TaxID=115357 RepID=UPI001E279948|nr:uncharacterized protein LOC123676001 [Harmonia axyridis]
MCAVTFVNPKALPLLLAAFALTISIFFEGKLTSEALPTMRFERSVDDGPLQGSDFLSLLMSAPNPPRSEEVTPATLKTSTESRMTRSTYHLHPYTNTIRKHRPTVGSLFKIERNNRETSENSDSEGIVVAVRVSSSVGKTLINKDVRQGSYEQEKNDLSDVDQEKHANTTPGNVEDLGSSSLDANHVADVVDQISIASEDHPSVIAESNKSEFNIEEKEPITTDSESSQSAFVEVPARLPDFNPPEDLLKQGQSQTKVHPYQQTIIFHNTGDSNQARSVSYSSVAQGVSSLRDKLHERQERNYDGSKSSDYLNNFGNSEKDKSNGSSSSQTQSYPVTESSRKPWNRPSSTSTPRFSERNWESPEKSYVPRPTQTPYQAQAEQNYEVDESVSVVTNGRVHGVQPPKQNADEKSKKDDNQKVGYVVEGRNYRKYRVEERTSDGFIVGEYGVVSHDDGSLRGVRYTADGTINPRLIYDALMKFLSL